MPKKRLPSYLHLPGNFVIRIHRVKPESMGGGNAAEWVIDADGSGGTLRINQTDTRDERIKHLLHELEHACADWRWHLKKLWE